MWRFVNQLRILLKPRDKFRLGGIFAGTVAGALLELGAVSILMPLMAVLARPEMLEANRYGKWLLDFAGGGNLRQFTLVCCGFIFFFYIFKNLYAYVLIYFQSRFTMRLISDFESRLLECTLREKYSYFILHGAGEFYFHRSLLGGLTTNL
ncbi:MAG: hypothetical protein PHS41_13445, partial [Victivallaceae bacterium]|nr:hypothetical protein [Victivallaceae bacterium]